MNFHDGFFRIPGRFLLIGFICLVSYGASADDELPLTLTPAPGISARIEKQEQDYVLIQPDGTRLELVSQDDVLEGEAPLFAEEDYDFDGHPDLSVGLRAGMVDIGQAIYLYDAGSKSYAAFDAPAGVAERQNCVGLWDIERLAARKAIRSNCRGGARWHYDILQIEPDRSVWISEQSRVPEEAIYWPYFSKPARSVTYDRSGRILSENVLAGEGDETWAVPVERIPLYLTPDEKTMTKAYLIKGDETTILAFEGDRWMKIAYSGKKDRIERWVSLKDAYDLARRYDPEQPSTGPLSLWAMDYSENRDDPDYYRNLFTLALDNVGEGEVEVREGEIHLVFSGPHGNGIVHKLYNISDFALKPAESHPLDDNVIEKHGDGYVIFHGSDTGTEYVPFFPPGLAPGRYKIRPVLTAPGLPAPLFANKQIEIDYPPRLRADLIKP